MLTRAIRGVKHLTAEELWHLAWPDVPWLSATEEDRRLYLDHAHSLALYNERKEA